MALADILNLSKDREKIGISEERIRAILPQARLAIAYWLNVPSGAAIIFFSVVFYALAKAIKSLSYQLFKRELA